MCISLSGDYLCMSTSSFLHVYGTPRRSICSYDKACLEGHTLRNHMPISMLERWNVSYWDSNYVTFLNTLTEVRIKLFTCLRNSVTCMENFMLHYLLNSSPRSFLILWKYTCKYHVFLCQGAGAISCKLGRIYCIPTWFILHCQYCVALQSYTWTSPSI